VNPLEEAIRRLPPGVEFLVVVTWAFGLPIFASIMSLGAPDSAAPVFTNAELLATIIFEVIQLGFLTWFLRIRGWTLEKFGLSFSWRGSALGVVLMAVKSEWHARYRWIVLALGAAGTLGAILAASAGEELADRIERIAGAQAARTWEDHAESGDTARNVAILFFVLLAAYVVVPWWQQRREPDNVALPGNDRSRWIRIGLAVLAIVGAAASVTTVIQAGHSGSRAVWGDYVK
jgi:hypothetical protein